MGQQQPIGKDLNDHISAADPLWSRNDLWDAFSLQGRISPTHQALSAIVAVIGDGPVVAAIASVEIGDDTYETTGFDVTVWSDALVIRAVRSGGAETPVVSVQARSALTGLEILRAPIVTATGFQARDERAEFRLTYPGRVVTLFERTGNRLTDLLPSLIRDLQA